MSSSQASPHTIAQALSWADQISSESPRLDVELLLCHCLQKDRSYLFTWPEQGLSDAQQRQFEGLFQRRKNGEPVAHILGQRDFWDLQLKVNPSTLIPRPDTELLVEQALRLLPQREAKVLDLGTGTGAIALALAKENPIWQVEAVDYSEQAVALARDNQQLNGIANIRIYQSDWFAQVLDQDFDLIVSNPPYIDADDHHLQQGDVRFEPLSALVADDQGLADIKHITKLAPQFLRRGGYLLLEHGYQQAALVRDILSAQGFSSVESYQDLGGNDRLTLGCKAD